MKLTVDASVAVKWVVDEVGHEAARRVIRSDVVVHAPTLLLAEVGNVIWKQVRLARFDRAMADRAASKIPELIDIFQDTRRLYPRALALALELDHPIYDCFYLACAEREETPLLTADRRLHAAAGRTDLADFVRLLV